MIQKRIILVSFLIINYVCIFCQESGISEMVQTIAEEMASDDSDPEATNIFIDQLMELAENPVRINKGDEAELSRLFFLSAFQVKALQSHIRTSGSIVSVYEIASIPGFDRRMAEMMIPFISTGTGLKPDKGSLYLRHNILTNIILKPGEKDTSSPGSQVKILSKYRFTAGSISGGITAEKDQGELLLSGSPSSPDFLSAHISYTGKGILKKVIGGDFSARFGQGTNISTGMYTALSPASTGYMQGRDIIRPYTSTDENNYFRGAAAEMSYRNAGLILFISRNSIDATVETNEYTAEDRVTNLLRTGLHNTASLLLRKDLLDVTTYGASLSYNMKAIRVGLLWSENRFSLPVDLKSGDPEDLYKFSGQLNRIMSLYYNSLINRMLLYGEMSYTDRGTAIVQGLTMRPSDRLTLNFLARSYSPGFTTFYGRGPGSGTSTSNENGLLGNFSFEAAKHLFISCGSDIARFPWLKYRNSFPSTAVKHEVKVKYSPDERINADLTFNHRRTMFNATSEQGIPGINELSSRTLKIVVKLIPDERITFVTRADYRYVEPSGSRGYLILQDFIYKNRNIPLTVWLRYSIYNTDGWESRIYTYENDLLYSFSIPAFAGTGSRNYIMVKWEAGDLAELRVKYGLTTQFKGNSPSEYKDELKIQFRIRF